MKRFTWLILTVGLCMSANSQLIDSYGLSGGLGLANQKWSYTTGVFVDESGWKNMKEGLMISAYAGKHLNNMLEIRTSLGYIQKGFRDEINMTNAGGEPIGTERAKVTLHNLSPDVSILIRPFGGKFAPYFLSGLRGDFLLGYKDHILEYQGSEVGIYEILLSEYEPFVLGGLFGVGLEMNKLIFLEAVYNPAFTFIYDSTNPSIRDMYLSLTLGWNIRPMLSGGN